MRRYRRLRPRTFRQATYLAPPRRVVYSRPRMSFFPFFGLVALVIILAGTAALVNLY